MGGGSGDGGGGGGGGGEEQVGRKKEGRKTKQLYGRKYNRRTEQPLYADQALLLALPLRRRHSPPLTPPAQIHPPPTIASPYRLPTTHAACPPLSRQLMHPHAMHSVSSTSTAVRIYNRSSNFHRIFRFRPQPRLFPPAPLQKLYISDVVSTSCWRRATRDRFYSYHWVQRVRALKAPRRERWAMPRAPNFLVHSAIQLVSANLTTADRHDLTRASFCNRSSSSCTASSSSGDILDMSASSISCQGQPYEHRNSRQSNYQCAHNTTTHPLVFYTFSCLIHQPVDSFQ